MHESLNFGPYYERVTNWILTQTNAAQYFAILSILLVCVLITLIFISDRFKYSRILFIICSITTIFIFRGLSLYIEPLNADEGLHLANAIALSHDRRLWVATDTTTFGPVPVVVILIVHKIISVFLPSFGITYFLVRLINIIIISVSFVLLNKVFESRLNRKIAWSISLFYVMFFSFFWYPDLQAFNSEYIYMFFISISLYAMYEFENKANIYSLMVCGLACGTMPFIKLQTVPMCAVLIMWSIFIILRRKYILFGKKKLKNHYSLLVYLGTVSFPLMFIFFYSLTYENGVENAFTYYILNAFAHVQPYTLSVFIKYLYKILFPFLLKFPWLNTISILALSAFVLSLALVLIKKFKAKIGVNYIFSCMLFLFSVEAVAYVLKLFVHYIVFIVVPALVFFMETIVLLSSAEYNWIVFPRLYIPKGMQQSFRRDNVVTFCLILLTVVLFSSFPLNVLRQTILSYKRIVGYENPYLAYAAQYVAAQTTDEDYVVVWGWEERVLVYANRKSGTAKTQIPMLYPPYPSKNIDIYISDIKRNKPKLIIDVVAPHSFTYSEWETNGLEKHAQIWSAIRDDYKLTNILRFSDDVAYRVYSRNK